MAIFNAALAIDFYKADHRSQYPEGTTEVYSNMTPRSSARASQFCQEGMVVFGIQNFILEFLIEFWDSTFFDRPVEEAVGEIKFIFDNALGKDAVSVDHFYALHALGYLPLEIKSLDEGTLCPMKVPFLTIRNTHPDFFWLTNSLETVMSSYLWKPCTAATIARAYRQSFEHYAEKTGFAKEGVPFQGHDFSFRGLNGLSDVQAVGAAHLTSFTGTDNVYCLPFLHDTYEAHSCDFVGGSIPATEHSVMCMGTKEGEYETYRRLIEDVYPSGFVSIVSDTWDYWNVLTETVLRLKDKILARDGRVVIRPDSGDPVKIICGDPDAPEGSPEYKGSIQVLWEIFGGTLTEKGYKLLDSHIGLIYGDSITLERQAEILHQLSEKGFCSGNVVLGIGSYTYQYVTRDTFGLAVKATSGVVNGERREIFKDPKTDNGAKKSARGLLRVEKENGTYVLYDQQTERQEKGGELKLRFFNGEMLNTTNLKEIRDRINEGL